MDEIPNLKVKRLSELLAELVDYTSMHTDEITDFTEGSAIRSIYEAIAMTQEQLYQLSTENVIWAIDHGILDAFAYTPKEAQRAFGTVTVDLYTPLAKDVVLARGTTVYSSVAGNTTLYYQTEQDYTITQGTTSFKIQVYCTVPGAEGNIPSNYIDSITTSQLSVLNVTNEDSFLTGKPEETAEELKKRFREFVATRGRATKRAVEYGINSIPEVAGCYIVEFTGAYDIYVHDANGDLPDSLRKKVEQAIEDYRPVSIPWTLKPMKKIRISLQIELAVTDSNLATDTFKEGLRLYVSDYLNHFKAGDDLVPNLLSERILKYSSLITDVKFNGGATYTTSPEEIIRAGNIYITATNKENFNGLNQIPMDDSDIDDTPVNPPAPDNSNKGTKLLGFTYYNFSYNYNKSISPVDPVSITYYDEKHVIITTLPYGITIDVDNKYMHIDGQTYTLSTSAGIPVYSLSYDTQGSTYTTYTEKGSIKSRETYDNFGGVDKIV